MTDPNVKKFVAELKRIARQRPKRSKDRSDPATAFLRELGRSGPLPEIDARDDTRIIERFAAAFARSSASESSVEVIGEG